MNMQDRKMIFTAIPSICALSLKPVEGARLGSMNVEKVIFSHAA